MHNARAYPASGAEICRFDLDPAQRKIEIGEPGVECTVEYRGHKREREKERYKLSLIREDVESEWRRYDGKKKRKRKVLFTGALGHTVSSILDK